MRDDSRRLIRVGALTLTALVVLAVGVFLIGEEQNLFSRKNSYTARFRSVSGLNPGNPVQLNGVDVGSVEAVRLPQDPSEELIAVVLSVDSRYAERIRADSVARIRTLGLLGDKYVEITSGSLSATVIPSGSEIPAETSSALEAIMTSGEDVMANVTKISSSLSAILQRMEQGEGLLGELITDRESGRKISDQLVETLDAVEQLTTEIKSGRGTLPRLINDPQLADRLAGTVDRLDATLATVEEGDGLLPALLNDPATRQSFEQTLGSLEASAADLAAFTAEVQEADGLLAKLLFDEQYGAELTADLERLLGNLETVSEKLAHGDGTAARLIEDPQVYEALNDIIVGVNESRLLRWLIRNRQKKGIEVRYEEAQEEPAAAAPEPRH